MAKNSYKIPVNSLEKFYENRIKKKHMKSKYFSLYCFAFLFNFFFFFFFLKKLSKKLVNFKIQNNVVVNKILKLLELL